MGFSLIAIAYRVPGILIGLSFHEFAHAWVANYYGDPTAKQQGRLTVNPFAHLDPLGTLALFLVGLGWARPVPVNPYNYRGNRRLADTMVSIAGPLSNLVLSLVFTGVLYLLLTIGFSPNDIISGITSYAIQINLVLFVFNLIPVPPLDGSHILFNLLPPGKREIYFNLQRYGYAILILLLFTGIAAKFIVPVVGFLFNLELALFGLR